MNAELKELLGLFTIIFLLVFFALMASYYVQRTACLNRYDSYEPQFGLWTGCRVEWEGKLTPTENIGFRNLN